MVNINKANLSTIDVKIVSAQESLYEGKADLVIATTVDGEIGVKPRHTPFLAMLKPGQAVVHNVDGDEDVFYISGGVIEVQPNMVTILADDAQRAKDIDSLKAEKAREHAERLLAEKHEKLDYAKLQIELAQSIAQLRALRRFKQQVEKRRK
jgi:F-type H+-transporting ATPase subunit epsilon